MKLNENFHVSERSKKMNKSILSSLVWMTFVANSLAFCDQNGQFCAYGTLDESGYNVLTIHSAATGWTSIGIGSSMTSCTEIYLIWKNSKGDLVLSPRNSTSHSMPIFNHVSRSYLTNLQYQAPTWANFAVSIAVPFRLDNNTQLIYANSNTSVVSPEQRNSNFLSHDSFGYISGLDFPNSQVRSLKSQSKVMAGTTDVMGQNQQDTGKWYPGKHLGRLFGLPPMSGGQPPMAGALPPMSGAQPPMSGVQPPMSGVQPGIGQWPVQQPSMTGQPPTLPPSMTGQTPMPGNSQWGPSYNGLLPAAGNGQWAGIQPSMTGQTQIPTNSQWGPSYNGLLPAAGTGQWAGQPSFNYRQQPTWGGQSQVAANGQWGAQQPTYNSQKPVLGNGQYWAGSSSNLQYPQSTWGSLGMSGQTSTGWAGSQQAASSWTGWGS